MSWADMAQEDELEEEEERELSKRVVNVNAATGELRDNRSLHCLGSRGSTLGS
ncbi:hypothetical protein GBA52_025243 [Prunus armeniaca]|nr:hypothetical protein GBA52_025243 [Prunus armeniaca]